MLWLLFAQPWTPSIPHSHITSSEHSMGVANYPYDQHQSPNSLVYDVMSNAKVHTSLIV